MSLRIQAWKLVLIAIAVSFLTGTASADRPPANVPPTWEIEVLDPNADPLSRPAVELNRGENGSMTVDIPPVVLVHRYYFTGERSFQAQLLPGGPTIVVANHPKTGERTYIDVQMPPGAPRVTYTDHAIEYDFGQTGVTVCFGLVGNPSVKYRSGPSVSDRISKMLRVDAIKENAQTTQQRLKQSAERTRTMAYGAASTVGEAASRVIDPAKGMLESLPFGKMVFDPTRGEKLIQKADDHKREQEIKRAEKQRRYDEITRKTNR